MPLDKETARILIASPARNWVRWSNKQQKKFHGQHLASGRIVGLRGDYALVHPIHHKGTVEIDLSLVNPWTSRNKAGIYVQKENNVIDINQAQEVYLLFNEQNNTYYAGRGKEWTKDPSVSFEYPSLANASRARAHLARTTRYNLNKDFLQVVPRKKLVDTLSAAPEPISPPVIETPAITPHVARPAASEPVKTQALASVLEAGTIKTAIAHLSDSMENFAAAKLMFIEAKQDVEKKQAALAAAIAAELEISKAML